MKSFEPSAFKSLVKRILQEEVEKKSSTDKEIYNRVPEVVHGEDYKKIVPHKRTENSKEEILAEIDKIVKEINKDFVVVWDDHDDISINAQGLFHIRVIPKWENNYCIEAYTHNQDRVYITGQSLEQVKAFIKVNLKNSDTYEDKAYKKSIDNDTSDKDSKPGEGMPQKNKPKTLPTTNHPFTKEKNKDKNYVEDDVKNDDDLPNKPLKEVTSTKKQIDHPIKGTKPDYKYPKQKDKKLVIKLPS
jgi:hypothetical protein